MSNYVVDILIKANDKATKEMKKVSDGLRDFHKKNKETFENMATWWAVAFAWISAWIFKATQMASDAQEIFTKFDVVFGDVSDASEKAAKNLRDNFGMASSTAKELLGNTWDLLTWFWLTWESALDLAEKTNQLAVDLASFTNFSWGAKWASDALNSALLWNAESVKALGIVILDSDVKAKIASMRATWELTDETDRQAKAVATLAIATEQSKNAMGDFQRTQEWFANQQRVLSERTKELSETFGGVFLPIMTEIVTSILPVVAVFSDWISENQELTKNIVLAVWGIAWLVTIIWVLGLVIPKIVAWFGFLVWAVKWAGLAIATIWWPISILISLAWLLAYTIFKNWDDIVMVTKQLWKDIEIVFWKLWEFFLLFANSTYERWANMMNMLYNWLMSWVERVKNWVMGIANTIKDFLGFGSPTKEWPWADSNKWIPNLIKMLSNWLDEWSSSVARASENVAKWIKNWMNFDNIKSSMQGLQSEAKNAFSNITDSIASHKEKVAWLASEYQALARDLEDINKKISWIKSQWSTDIASRAVSIQDEMFEIQTDLSKNATNMNETEKEALNLKLQKLQAELEIANLNTTQAEIDEARRIAWLTQTETIIEQMGLKIAEAEREKKEISIQMELKQKQVKAEMLLHVELMKSKEDLDKAYFLFFGENIKSQKREILETITLLKQMQSMVWWGSGWGSSRGSSRWSVRGARADWWPVDSWSTYLVGERWPELFTPSRSWQIVSNEKMQGWGMNISINMWWVTVNNTADENRLVEKISEELKRKMQLFNYWIA